MTLDAGADSPPAQPAPDQRLTLFDRFTAELTANHSVRSEIEAGKRIGFYRLLRTIGAGNFSQVKLANHVITREKVAVKILDKMKLSAKTQRLLSKEISCMERLQHPHIIRLYEVMETMTKLFMVMEYAPGGELYTHVTTKGKFDEGQAKVIFAQIVSAVDHMHAKHVVHRDIKAENVFITGPLCVKVGDFGFSALARPDQTLNTFCGSPPYAAPELFKDDYYLGGAVDAWAVGVLLYFLLTAVTPFRADTVGRLKSNILAGRYLMPPTLTPACRRVISGLLRHSAAERLTLRQVKDAEWMEGLDFPRAADRYEINPRVDLTCSQASQASERLLGSSGPGSTLSAREDPASADELEVHRQLLRLGITEEHVRRSAGQASRSSVTGVYRIMLHQLQRRHSSSLSPVPVSDSDSDPSPPRRLDAAKTKVCVLL